MEEEFQESEIIFYDHHHHHQHTNNYREMVVTSSQFVRSNDNSNSISNNQNLSRKKKKKKSSLPVNIPETIFQFPDSDEFEEEEGYYYDNDDGDDDGEFVPPHLIMSRRIAGKMAFSVCTGNGRTLKGRDLSHVRNSILKLTGFLET